MPLLQRALQTLGRWCGARALFMPGILVLAG